MGSISSAREVQNGIIVEIKAKPGCAAFSIYRKGDDVFVEVRSPPEDNRANIEILRELKRLFGQDVKILSGFKSKRKSVFIPGLDKIGLGVSIAKKVSGEIEVTKI